MNVVIRSLLLTGTLVAFCGALFLYGPAIREGFALYRAQYTDATYALYLSSGHTFYGNIRAIGRKTITLAHVYTFQAVSVGDSTTNNLLAQRSNPLTMPEDWLVIKRDEILFYERLTPSARILSLMRGE